MGEKQNNDNSLKKLTFGFETFLLSIWNNEMIISKQHQLEPSYTRASGEVKIDSLKEEEKPNI